MVEAVSNISSAGFRFLCKGELEEGEAKEFTAKNIMLNLQAIFRETIVTIEQCEVLKGRINLEELRN
jgi:hypothetical protein